MLSTTEDGSPLNVGGFTLSGRLPIKESNQFLYAVSKARPVCCNDGALTSRSQGNSVFIRVSSRLRCAGEVLVLLLEYLVCEVQKMIVHKSGATKLTRSQENLL